MTCKYFFKNLFHINKFCLNLTDKIPTKLFQNYKKKVLLFLSCFTLTVSFYKIGKQPL